MNAPTIFDKNTLKYFTAEIFKRIGNMEGVDIRSGGVHLMIKNLF